MKNPVVTILMENGRKIKVELYPKVAPNTVRNFIDLSDKGFYNGTIFHRVIPNFMIQGGDPNGDGTGGSGKSIAGEFDINGFDNDLSHTKGVISMARSAILNSASSQFFIVVADSPHLDGSYAAFGKVVDGMDEVERISNENRDSKDKPITNQKIISITVEKFGETYAPPDTI